MARSGDNLSKILLFGGLALVGGWVWVNRAGLGLGGGSTTPPPTTPPPTTPPTLTLSQANNIAIALVQSDSTFILPSSVGFSRSVFFSGQPPLMDNITWTQQVNASGRGAYYYVEVSAQRLDGVVIAYVVVVHPDLGTVPYWTRETLLAQIPFGL